MNACFWKKYTKIIILRVDESRESILPSDSKPLKTRYMNRANKLIDIAFVAALSLCFPSNIVLAFTPTLPSAPCPTLYNRCYFENDYAGTLMTSRSRMAVKESDLEDLAKEESVLEGSSEVGIELEQQVEEGSIKNDETVLEDSSGFEPLAIEGPWQAFLDDSKTGLLYYYNVENGENSWEKPTSTFPKVTLSRQKKKRVLAIRQEYVESQKWPFNWDWISNQQSSKKPPKFLSKLYNGSNKIGNYNYPDLKKIKPKPKLKRNPYRNNAPVKPGIRRGKQLFKR